MGDGLMQTVPKLGVVCRIKSVCRRPCQGIRHRIPVTGGRGRCEQRTNWDQRKLFCREMYAFAKRANCGHSYSQYRSARRAMGREAGAARPSAGEDGPFDREAPDVKGLRQINGRSYRGCRITGRHESADQHGSCDGYGSRPSVSHFSHQLGVVDLGAVARIDSTR